MKSPLLLATALLCTGTVVSGPLPDRGEMLDWVLVLDDAAKKFPEPGSLNPN